MPKSLLLCLLLLLPLSNPAERPALLIGNTAYPNDGLFRPLGNNPINDVSAMKQSLQGFGFRVVIVPFEQMLKHAGAWVVQEAQERVSLQDVRRVRQVEDSTVLRASPPTHRPAVSHSALIQGRYQNKGNGTVTDVKTGLTWMRCLVGQRWDGQTCVGEAKGFDWYKACQQGAQFAGASDWRIPTLGELRSLVYCSSGKPNDFNSDPQKNEYFSCDGDYQRPTLVQAAFPDAPASVVWSDLPDARDLEGAWGVYFGNGEDYGSFRGSPRHVRLVRGGQ